MYFHVISLILSSNLLISVNLCSSLLLMVYGLYTFNILPRHLFWKVSHLFMSQDSGVSIQVWIIAEEDHAIIPPCK